jgi:hypothetical protein
VEAVPAVAAARAAAVNLPYRSSNEMFLDIGDMRNGFSSIASWCPVTLISYLPRYSLTAD